MKEYCKVAGHKNQLHFHMLTINSFKRKLRKQSHLQWHQKNKILKNKFKQGDERLAH